MTHFIFLEITSPWKCSLCVPSAFSLLFSSILKKVHFTMVCWFSFYIFPSFNSLSSLKMLRHREKERHLKGILRPWAPSSLFTLCLKSDAESTHMLKVRPWWGWPHTELCLLIGNGLQGIKQTKCSFAWASVAEEKGCNRGFWRRVKLYR